MKTENLLYKMKFFATLVTVLGVVALTTTKPASAQYLGVTTGYSYANELTGPVVYPLSTNIALYNPTAATPDKTWASWVEQYNQAGIDFVAADLVGSTPNASHPPTQLSSLVTAINNASLTNSLKIAIFDDNGSSWLAQYSLASGYGYTFPPLDHPFDMSNPANWKYLYDYDYKLFYQTVPDANRFKINGRPVIFIWTGNPTYISNENGNYSKAVNYVRQQCQADFGFNPWIVVNNDAVANDPTLTAPGVIDGTHSWYGVSNPYNLSSYNGTSTGTLVPGYGDAAHTYLPSFIDPNHGQLLDTGLTNTVGKGALLTVVEGFTDYGEEASLWRTRNIDQNGNAMTYAQTEYDYPNQRLSILRAHSRNPFPASQTFEAEGSDYFGGGVSVSAIANYYRNGNIAIDDVTDTGGGYFVGWIQSGEWLEWEHVPLNGTPHIVVRVASPIPGAQIQLVIDGIAQPAQTIPNTGDWQTWTSFDMGPIGTFSNSYHTIRIVFPNGGLNLNWWQTQGGTPSL
ncbi:DUF5010 domain-containing protein [Granulicella sp. S190]|uniref:DUF5010 domain-containing protein n=1 Tax=Granulicella sp. S190 TaxID=1747226 RepID=UPI00131AB5DC|nr:DUF5010 domain-containing protein [Granulicella sp. S190]